MYFESIYEDTVVRAVDLADRAFTVVSEEADLEWKVMVNVKLSTFCG